MNPHPTDKFARQGHPVKGNKAGRGLFYSLSFVRAHSLTGFSAARFFQRERSSSVQRTWSVSESASPYFEGRPAPGLFPPRFFTTGLYLIFLILQYEFYLTLLNTVVQFQ